MGVEVTTLRGLALKTCPPIPLSEPIQPIDNPLLQRLGPDGARTGLESLLMAHVGEIRLHDLYAASPLSATSLPNGMPALTQISWGETESEVAIRTFIQRLEQRADAPRKGPLAAEAYDRVLAVGFGANPSESSPLGTDESDFLNTWSQGVGDSLDPVSAWERTALRLLGAIALAPEIGTSQMATSIPVVEVPDVLAEARLCVRTILHAAPTGSDRSVLVLVANPQTAARLSTVGTANALPIGRRGALQLSGHPAALVFRNAAPWFSGVTDPYLRASSLERVFGGPCVTWKFPAPVRDRLAKQIQGLPQIDGAPITEGRETSISGNALRELLHNARIANAPLSAWRERIHVLAEPMDGDDTRPTWRVTSRRRPAIV
ncbi:MAG: hypothetical protein GWP91_17810, partial [Rhodobacterales bacterium]|nr:hypothetical protein [Rhodobacterales bacterium]